MRSRKDAHTQYTYKQKNFNIKRELKKLFIKWVNRKIAKNLHTAVRTSNCANLLRRREMSLEQASEREPYIITSSQTEQFIFFFFLLFHNTMDHYWSVVFVTFILKFLNDDAKAHGRVH